MPSQNSIFFFFEDTMTGTLAEHAQHMSRLMLRIDLQWNQPWPQNWSVYQWILLTGSKCHQVAENNRIKQRNMTHMLYRMHKYTPGISHIKYKRNDHFPQKLCIHPRTENIENSLINEGIQLILYWLEGKDMMSDKCNHDVALNKTRIILI